MATSKTAVTYTFEDLKSSLTANFKKLSSSKLFYVAIDRDRIWEEYLSGFDEPSRQGHNCNACKSFLRQFAGIVTIEDNQIISIWDNLEVSEEYQQSIENVQKYIHSLPVTDIFLSAFKKCGTDRNLDRESGVTWNHFYIEVPSSYVTGDITTKLGPARDDKAVLKRSLDELTLDATETVLDLVAQDSLYRGKEFKNLLESFQTLQKQYKKVSKSLKDNYCWAKSGEVGSVVSRIRNTALGTLLIDLSEGMELDAAVSRFEKVMAPTNYKRPTALVTPKMVEQAKETLSGLGLLESLERRYAVESDLSMNNVLFTERTLKQGDVFDEISKETIVNPRTLSKIEEISIKEFLSQVVPKAKSISVLVENAHLSNFVSLITAVHDEVPSLFKWDNPFSWDYTGGVTDSIKERVKQAGGRVEGELRTSLSWSNFDDLDIHVIEPGGNRIYYGAKKGHVSTGELDVDMNAGGPQTRSPVENIIWTDKSRMREGMYTVSVHNYSRRETTNAGFQVQIECAGEVFDFEYKTNPRNGEHQQVVQFNYSKTDGITFQGETKSNVVSKEKWGVKTNQFHKVTKILLSPNFWDNVESGNKHYLFMLEGCVSDETPRPFFNEFLKQELDTHRKVFEILGSKVKIQDSSNQLSGVGFSETKRNSLIVKVNGKFTRTLRVNF